ncbi:hypothetical protein HU200_027185 [Digitaria exilis]|uniref:Transcription repressor n=1 Tax=Digitaria exilis TaxID=1010633 RepID=A0A835C283_9POAL|nr:hypothetical protein HU200_027185 [Digitaria exilis]
MAKKGLVSIFYKLRDVHRPPPPSPSTPSAHYAQRRCYPPPPSSWPWPSCRHPRTSSFRGSGPTKDDAAAAAVFRTANTVYDTASEQFLRRSSIDEPACFDRSPLLALPADAEEATAGKVEDEEDKEMQLRETAVVRGMRSERLFFEPSGAEFLPPKQVITRSACRVPMSGEKAPFESVLIGRFQEASSPARGKDDEEGAAVVCVEEEDTAAAASAPEKNESTAAAKGGGAVVVTVESKDPYGDFRASMAEMVAAHGLRDWEAMEELLAWYLKLNAKGVHAAIVGAFIDLLVSMQPPEAAAASASPPLPSPSSSCITFEEYSSATFDEEECKS